MVGDFIHSGNIVFHPGLLALLAKPRVKVAAMGGCYYCYCVHHPVCRYYHHRRRWLNAIIGQPATLEKEDRPYLFFWLYIHFVVGGKPDIEPSITPFGDNLHYFGTVICDWGALGNGAYPYAAVLTALVLLALIAVLLWKAFKGKINSYENIVIAFTIVYGLFIVVWASIQRFERINSRLLSPMFIPLLIACTSWVPDVLKLVRSKAKYALAGVAILLMVAFECATYQVDWQRYDDENDYGVPGYSDDGWNKSEFVVYLRQHKKMFTPTVPIYTDADEAVYLFTGLSSTLIPHKFFQKDVQKFYSVKHFYLVWFDNLSNPELLSLQDVMKHKKLVKIGTAKQGDIYVCDER